MTHIHMNTCDICFACGMPVGSTLAFTASLRCPDCRAWEAPLRRDLVEEARRLGLRP